MYVLAAEFTVANVVTVAVATLALGVSVYSAALARRGQVWQRKRDDERLSSEITVLMTETSDLGDGEPRIGERRERRHRLITRVLNGGEAPEYVRQIELRSDDEALPLTVSVPRPEGTTEVRPRDESAFVLTLDGHQAFAWGSPFHVVVALANGAVFESERGALLGSRPHHGEPFIVPDIFAEDTEVSAVVSLQSGKVTVVRSQPDGPEREPDA